MYTEPLPWYVVVLYITTLLFIGLHARLKMCPSCTRLGLRYDSYFTTDGVDPYWFEIRQCEHCNFGQYRQVNTSLWYDGLSPYD
jgi:hypothetical protein